MKYEPSFRDRLDRLRVLTVERGHTQECATGMAYSNCACSCGVDHSRAGAGPDACDAFDAAMAEVRKGITDE